MPDDPRMNAPDSGAYGEGTDLANLKKALPAGAIGNPSNTPPPGAAPPPVSPQPAAAPTAAPVGRPPGASAPPGVPQVLMGPTQQPDTAVSTPLASPMTPPSGAANPQQARMAVLDALVHSPNVSADTKAWAKSVINILLTSSPAG